jgi:hypothetical protein
VLIVILLLLVALLASLWFTGFIARALDAGRPGLLWVFLLFVALIIAQILIGLTPLVQHPLLALLVVVAVSTTLFIWVLDMKPLKGFLTMLVSSVVSFILLLAVGVISGVGLSGYQDYLARVKGLQSPQTFEEVALAAESICLCETDETCLKEKSKAFGRILAQFSAADLSPTDQELLSLYNQRGFECTLRPGPYNVSRAVIDLPAAMKRSIPNGVVSNTHPPARVEQVSVLENTGSDNVMPKPEIENPVSAVVEEPEEDFKPGYYSVAVKDAEAHLGKPVRVDRQGKDSVEGILTAVEKGKIMIEQRSRGGVFSFPVAMKDIKAFEVYLQSPLSR